VSFASKASSLILCKQILFLQDWYIETGTQQLDGLLSFPFLFVGNPNSFLINGKGIAPECQAGGANFNNSLMCLPACQNDTLSLLSTVNVTAGMTYRLRLINSGQLVYVNVAIARHNMTIVQVEGTNVEPLNVSSIDIGPGQRYDVLVTADQPAGSYMIEATVRERPIFDVKGMAIFQYDGSPIQIPTEAPPHPRDNETTFGIAQDVSLRALDASNYPPVGALNATNVKRYVLVGTQNGEFQLCSTTAPSCL
jgi:FtsP/CotA-like multicopper oxidase with cupredoxin domain